MSQYAHSIPSEGSEATLDAYQSGPAWREGSAMDTDEYYGRSQATSYYDDNDEVGRAATPSGSQAPSDLLLSDAESSHPGWPSRVPLIWRGRKVIDRELERVAGHMLDDRESCMAVGYAVSEANPDALAKELASLGGETARLETLGRSWLDASVKFLQRAPTWQNKQQGYHDSILGMRSNALSYTLNNRAEYNAQRQDFLRDLSEVRQKATEYHQEGDRQVNFILGARPGPSEGATPQVSDGTQVRVQQLRQRLHRTLGSTADGGYVENTPMTGPSEVAPSQRSRFGAVTFGYSSLSEDFSRSSRQSVMVA